MTHALELSHSFFKETSVAGKYGKKCQDRSVHRRKFSTAQSLIAAFWIKIWFEKRATTKLSLLHTVPPSLAPKDLRCFCDSKHLIFPKLQKSDILKGGGVGMELKQLHRADVSSYSAVKRNAASLSQPSPYSQQFTCNILNMWCMTQRASNLTFNRLEPCGKTLLYLGCDISWHTPSPWKAPDSWFISVTLGLK